MGVPGSANLLLLGGEQGYKIERSLRFNSADSAYLDRGMSAGSGRKQFTISFWTKISKLGTNRAFVEAYYNGTNFLVFGLDTSDKILNYSIQGGTDYGYVYTPVYRDPSAWYHFMTAWDTDNATATQRIRTYVNGVEITAKAADYGDPPSGYVTDFFNTGFTHSIGRRLDSGVYYDGLMTEFYVIDGQALTPSSFGETDTITNVWKPKKYAGTYGTNGFYLNFSDNSGTTSTTLGKDSSGNSNNWTPNNFSVTAGAGNDSLIDTPTPYADGGNGRGNYCTLNPLDNGGLALANGNLEGTYTASAWRTARATFAITSGKWYWEVSSPNATTGTSPYQAIMAGIAKSAATLTSYVGSDASGWSYFNVDGTKYTNGSNAAYGSTWTSANTIGIAFDADNGTLTFYRDNTSQGTAFTGLTSGPYFPAVSCYSGSSVTAVCNFGQRPFAYTPPSGFVALNTQNLPEPSIKKPSSYMDVVTYTGDGAASGRNISTTTNPSLAWIKSRSIGTGNHFLFDSVRGAINVLGSNQTIAEYSNSDFALGTGQFTVGDNGGSDDYNPNKNASTYVAWLWNESATPGFDIVTYTGNGTGQDVNHSLGVTPSLMILKRRDSGPYSWPVYHASYWNITNGLLFLDSTSVGNSNFGYFGSAPSSTTFRVNTAAAVNASGGTYVAYLWSEVAGFSKFGSYTGNGSSDGPFVFCGFRPRWVMIKRTDSTSSWHIYDTVRGTTNVITTVLAANLSDVESYFASGYDIDFVSNGFKPRTGPSIAINTSGGTYIFCAWAEAPFKYALAR